MFARSITRLTLALIIVVVSLLLVTSFTVTAAAPIADARPSTDLIVNPGESIQAAIDAANDGDTIIVNAGDYTESLTLSKPVSLTGVNSDTTILHAVAGQRVLTVTGATISNSVVISGLTLTGGDVAWGDAYAIPGNCGGAIVVVGAAAPTLENTRIISNTAWQGGGIWADQSLTLTLTHVEVISNSATTQAGGVQATYAVISGVQFADNSSNEAPGALAARYATITNSNFVNNVGVYDDYSLYGGGGAANLAIAYIFDSRFDSNHGPRTAVAGYDLYLSNTLLVNNTTTCQLGLCAGGAVAYDALTLVNSRVEGNSVNSIGESGAGGVFGGYSMFVTNTDFIRNTAITNYRGAGALRGNNVWLSGGHFEHNTTNADGGAIYATHAYVQGTQFRDNTAASGGAILGWCCVDIDNALFENNHALGNYGGGALMVNGTINITGTRFISNSSSTSGGAIAQGNFEVTAITNTLFAHNTATSGGAILSVWGIPQSYDPDRELHLVNDTIADSNLNPSSAIDIPYGSLYVTNTIIANHAIGLSTITGTVTEDYNLFYGNVTNTIGVSNGAHSIIGDPRFIDPAHNDYHLAFGSAAIDHGVDAGVYTDLDGNVRPQGAGFDIGAYEYQGPSYRVFLPLLQK